MPHASVHTRSEDQDECNKRRTRLTTALRSALPSPAWRLPRLGKEKSLPMSHDGCIEVAWKGKAFSYLMHHPNSFHETENYGSAKHGHAAAGSGAHGHGAHGAAAAGGGDGESVFQAGTGTWNGPAPRGARQSGQAAASSAATAPIREPEFVRLSSGAKMPLIGLGSAALKSADAVKQALGLGYRHFDCAEFYGSEPLVGEGLAEFVAAGRREELFVVSKVWNTHHRPADVRAACEKSLKDLGLQYLDLYLMHWPCAWMPNVEGIPQEPEVDATVTLEQTWAAMEELVDSGLVRAIGVSNFSLLQVEKLLGSCRIKPAVNQIELHPRLAQRKLVGVLFRKGVQCVAYSPLGGQSHFCPNDLKEQDLVARVAQESGKTPAQVLLKWNIQRGVAVIPKASSEEHLRENLDGLFTWRLSNEHKALLDTMDCGKRYITFSWMDWGNVEEGGVVKPSTVVL